MENALPWFYETTGPCLLNEWTWTHVAWGMASVKLTGNDLTALAGHTLYEAVEGRIFPDPYRDTSFLNHVGDTLAFIVGRLLVGLLQ
jgi:hypothetical protein